MGNMTVIIMRVIHISKPFLQLVMFAYLHRRQALDHALQAIAIRCMIGI